MKTLPTTCLVTGKTYQLNNLEILSSAITNIGLLKDAIKHKNRFNRTSYSNYDARLNTWLKLSQQKDITRELEKDYRNMRDIIHWDAENFDELIDCLSVIEASHINPL